jgi:hypothetical protein
MTQRPLRIPGILKHTGDDQTDANLQEKAREHVDRHPAVRFLADVLRALHGSVAPIRNAKTFYSGFGPRDVMDAFAQRPDLRVKAVRAITCSPAALLRRLSSEALASQIELLVVEDLPEGERAGRADGDRALSVYDLYLKYLDPVDLATYLPAQAIWAYESHDDWWKWEPSNGARALMAAELRSVRRHSILTDSQILDLLGDEALETHLPVAFRTGLRRIARRAAAEGRPFTDADLFDGLGGGGGARDLIDEMVESVPLPQLREIVVHAGRVIGLAEASDNDAPTKVMLVAPPKEAVAHAVPLPGIGQRIGPKPTPAVASTPAPLSMAAAAARPRASIDRGATPIDRGAMTPPPRSIPPTPVGKMAVARAAAAPTPFEAEGPPGPDDDDLALLEELSDRVL